VVLKYHVISQPHLLLLVTFRSIYEAYPLLVFSPLLLANDILPTLTSH